MMQFTQMKLMILNNWGIHLYEVSGKLKTEHISKEANFQFHDCVKKAAQQKEKLIGVLFKALEKHNGENN